ncbi:hypothetical protein [Avibacterium paragallinarum]|uniref:hypothetical protein n=1 Tax=Avibacterium paragallinarum TaxID=728 RepID=UPI002EDA0690
MIVSDNNRLPLSQFCDLMQKVDNFLNQDAKYRTSYYKQRSGLDLEKDVYNAVCHCSKNTPFENTISLVSGKLFPDIVANQYYGIEVKSTQGDKWTSIGSSILESTRIPNVERIFLTFGKLGGDITFLSKPYEQCLSDIAVTHYPRYKIDMLLTKGESIFEKMGIPYDTLRNLENPISPVANYYKSHLRKGESLWWVSNNILNEVSPPKVRHWKVIDREERDMLIAQAYSFFPETILSNSRDKYDKFALWLATKHGIINTSLRDDFSAGGQQTIYINDGSSYVASAVLKRVETSIRAIKYFIQNTPIEYLQVLWDQEIEQDRILQWKNLVLSYCRNPNKNQISLILNNIICEQIIFDNIEQVNSLKEMAGEYIAYKKLELL